MWSWESRKRRYKAIENSIPSIFPGICLPPPPVWPPVSLSFFLCWDWKKLWEAGVKKSAGVCGDWVQGIFTE